MIDGACYAGHYQAVFDKLNGVHICFEGDDTCRTNTTDEAGARNAQGVILYSRAHLWGGDLINQNKSDGFVIDYNGTAGANTMGDDILFMARCNLEASSTANTCSADVSRHAKINPFPSYASNMALYKELYE